MTTDITWHILLVDDDEDDYLLTREMLSSTRRGKFQVDWVSTYDAGLNALLTEPYDAALVDFDMGARSGVQLIREVNEAGCATPIILFTGRGTYEVDVEAMQAGAMDYLTKGETNPALLERAVRYAIERKRHEREMAAANEALSAANAQLTAGRQELAEILGSIRDGFFSLDHLWRYVYINSVAAQRSGMSPAQLIGETIWEVFPDLIGTELWERYHEVMDTRRPAQFETYGVVSKEATYEIRVYPSASGISIFWIDVTEKKVYQEALQRERKKEEEALLARQQWMLERIQQIEAVFENAPAGMAILEPEPPFRVLSYNRQFQSYLPEQFHERSLSGMMLSEIFDKTHNPELLGVFEEVLKTGKTSLMTETPYDGLERGRTWWNWSLALVRSGEQVTGLAMLVVDVTDTVQTRSVVEKERAFLNAVLEQLPSAVMIFDAQENRVILANQQVEKIFRVGSRTNSLSHGSREDFYSTLSQFFSGGRLPSGVEWPFDRALHEGAVIRDEEIPILRGDGTQGVFSISTSPIFDPQQRILAAVAVFQDVTERRRADRDSTFLISLGPLLNQQAGAEELLLNVAQRLVTHLDAHRCLFFEVDLANEMISFYDDSQGQPGDVHGPFTLDQLPQEALADQQAGRVVINRDAKSDPRTADLYRRPSWPVGMRSYVSVPLMRSGCWVATMLIDDTRPRKWNDRQVTFLQTVAERTWAAYETHRLLEALRDNQERLSLLAEDAQLNLKKLESIIDNMKEAVFISDLNGRFIRVNPAALELHGFSSQEEMTGDLQTIFDVVEVHTPEGLPIPISERPVIRATRGETVLNFEMHARRTDTGKAWVGLYTSIPVRDEHGSMLFILSTVVDITHIRESEIQRTEMRAALQTQHLLVAQREEERIQIARDIHDGPLQDLIALTYTVQNALAERPEAGSHQAIEILRERSQKLVSDLRGVCNELRPPLLARFGLARAIQSHAEDLQDNQPVPAIHLDLDEDHETLPVDVRLALYRIYQESLRNIQRHARATECHVRLRIQPEVILLEIQDNGAGFDLPSDWLTLARQGHLGLVGIKERAEAVGGHLELTSTPGAGTLLRVSLPRQR